MEKKASFLPKGLCDIYYNKSDAEKLIENWTSEEAKYVWYTLLKRFQELDLEIIDTIDDVAACPYCIKTDMKCNKCEYFKLHGLCGNKYSDYTLITNHLFPTDKTKGIMSYIIKVDGAINELLAVLLRGNKEEKDLTV